MIRGWLLPALLLALGTGAAQATTVYECALAGARSGEWVSPRLAIAYDPRTGAAKVADGITLAFSGRPLDARILSETPRQIVFVWDVRITDRQGQANRMAYHARWLKHERTLRVTARPMLPGGPGGARSGTCQILEHGS